MPKLPNPSSLKPMGLEQLALVTHQLSVLLNSGVSLVPALSIFTDCGQPRIEASLDRVCRDVESGRSLSQALSQQPESFTSLYRRSVLSGEKTGRLAEILGRLSEQLNYQVELQRRVKAALTYPACITAFALSMIAFLLYVQVPSFLRIFHSSGQPVPAITQVLIVASNPKFGFGLLLALVMVALWIYRHWRRPGGRAAIIERLYGLPILGRLLALRDISQMCNELATMLSSGVELLGALSALASEEVPSPYFQAIPPVIELIRDGESLSQSMAQQKIFPPLLIAMLEAGEETGQLWGGLSWYAELAYSQLVDTIDVSMKLVEPLVMGLLGLTVTFIALASFLPIYQLISE